MPTHEGITGDPRREALRSASTRVVLNALGRGGRPTNPFSGLDMELIGEVATRIGRGEPDKEQLLAVWETSRNRVNPTTKLFAPVRYDALRGLQRLSSSALHQIEGTGGELGDIRLAADEARVHALVAGRERGGPVIREYVPQVDKTTRLVHVYGGANFGSVLGYPTPQIDTLTYVRQDGVRQDGRVNQEPFGRNPHASDVVIQVGFDGEVMDDAQAPAGKGIQTYVSFDGTLYRVGRQITLPKTENEPLDPLRPPEVVLIETGTDERQLVAERARQALTQHRARHEAVAA